MTAKKKDGGMQIKIDGQWQKLEWSEIAVLTAEALKRAPGPPGLLVDLETWRPDWLKLEWFAHLKAMIDRHLRAEYRTGDKPITPDIEGALNASRRLTEILTQGFVTDDHRQFLPIEVAAVARTASAANKIKAKKPRTRTHSNVLKDAKLKAMARGPGLTWKELLLQLEGDEIVVDWDDKKIVWIDAEGNKKNKSTKTFRNWKTD